MVHLFRYDWIKTSPLGQSWLWRLRARGLSATTTGSPLLGMWATPTPYTTQPLHVPRLVRIWEGCDGKGIKLKNMCQILWIKMIWCGKLSHYPYSTRRKKNNSSHYSIKHLAAFCFSWSVKWWFGLQCPFFMATRTYNFLALRRFFLDVLLLE